MVLASLLSERIVLGHISMSFLLRATPTNISLCLSEHEVRVPRHILRNTMKSSLKVDPGRIVSRVELISKSTI